MTSGLESWDAEYQGDSAWAVIRDMIEKLESRAPADQNQRNLRDRLLLSLKIILGRYDTPSLLISPGMMSQFQTTVVQQMQPHVNAWAQNGNVTNLNQAHTVLVNTLLDQIRGWPATERESLRSAAATLREATKSIESHRRLAAISVQHSKQALEAATERFNGELEAQLAEVIQRHDAIETEITQTDQTLAQLKSQVDAAVEDYLQRFIDAEATRLDKHQDNLADQTKQFRSALDQALEDSETLLEQQETDAKTILKRIDELKVEAENVVGAVGTATTAKWYADRSLEQSKLADTWRYVAMGGFVLAFAFSFIWIVWLHQDDDSVQNMFVKATLSITLLAAASYAIAESSRHRKAEFEAKRTELTLRALDPFIANIEKGERERMKIATAEDVFLKNHHRRMSLPFVAEEEVEEEDEE